MNGSKVLTLVDAVYSAASDPSLWPSVACQIQHAIGGHSVNLVLQDTTNSHLDFVFTNGATSADLEYYTREVVKNDEFICLFDNLRTDTTILTQQLFEERSLHKMRGYDEYYEKLGYSNFVANQIYRTEDKRGWLTIARSLKDPLYTNEELQIMQSLNPHLQRAILINMQLMEAQKSKNICFDALEHLSVGVIFLSCNGHLVHSNSKAQKYLRNINNIKQNFRVILPDHSANIKLQKAIAETLYSNKVLLGRFIPFKEGDHQNMVICLPWKMNEQSYDWLNNQVGCLLFILPSNRTLGSPDKLMAAFDVSRSESHVLSGIMNGLSTEQLANKLCISQTTVRFHIKNLLRKFSSHNQIEMLSKVNRLLSINTE